MRYIPETCVKLYAYFPSYTRNVFATSFGLIKKLKEYNKYFFEQLKEIQKNEWQNLEYLNDLQSDRLKRLIKYVEKKVPLATFRWKDIEDNVILTEELFNEAAKVGNVIKNN